MDTLRYELGLKIPDDVSVVGYDDVPAASWPSYLLTTVQQPVNIMVRETVEILIEKIENPEARPQKIKVDGPLILRKSAQEDRRVVAIGELGLDFFKNENKTQQIDALIPQMELAYELDLPVIIHCRDAANEMIEICSDLSKKGKCPDGVLHCWTGTPKEMKQFLNLGFYISFSGIVTFPKAHEIHECAKIVPNDKYLIETDSPFLAPVPHRGKRNEPAFVENVANFIADLRSTDLLTIAKQSSKNAEDLFKFNLIS